MNTRNYPNILLLLGLVWQLPAAASQVEVEAEPNNSIEAAQNVLQSAKDVVVQADFAPFFSVWSTDLDFYSFEVQSGEEISAAIASADVNTIVALFREGDPRDTQTGLPEPVVYDQKLEEGVEPTISHISAESGTYIVGVAPKNRNLFWDASLVNELGSTGSYTLALAVKRNSSKVPIVIKRGSVPAEHKRGKPEHAGSGKGGVIPVAILSTDTFNAMEVDRESLTFGKTGQEQSLSHCNRKGKHMDGNSRADLVCFFRAAATELTAADKEGLLKGRTRAGEAIEGADAIRPER